MQRTTVLLFLLAGFFLSPAFAAEIITSFNSDLQVHSDGTLTVTETIAVVSEGRQIQRGIYRDFPTVRGRTLWGAFRVDFEVLEVLRDGVPESWFSESIFDGRRVYIGDASRTLNPGPHTFTITYRTDRQIGFFDSHDELYWNVTGNFWTFPIEKASAQIRLPPGASVTSVDAFTGRIGAKESFAEVAYGPESAAVSTTKVLERREGLTAVFTWPKGFVSEPTVLERMRYAARDNASGFIGLAGLILVIIFYVNTWNKYGRDPERGTIIAEYDPPKKLSPAACRYILNMGWDEKVFTSALVSMAARGFIRMKEKEDDIFTISRTNKSSAGARLSPGELAINRNLFANGQTSITLESEERETLDAAISALKRALRREHNIVHFVTNSGVLWGGATISAGTLFVMIFPSLGRPATELVTDGFILTAVILFAVNFVFFGIMKAPTRLGRRLMDHIEGFKRYLTVVENEWGEQFHAAMVRAAADRGETWHEDDYTPNWYSGRSRFEPYRWRKMSTTLTQSVATATTPPSSSSGSRFSGGGGGFSGGGGGGGGGGGW